MMQTCLKYSQHEISVNQNKLYSQLTPTQQIWFL